MAANIEVMLTGNTGGLEAAVQRAAATVSASTTQMLDGITNVGTGMAQTEKVVSSAGQIIGRSMVNYQQSGRAANEYAAAQILVRNAINEVRAAERAGTVDRQAAAAQIIQLRTVLSAARAEYTATANEAKKFAAAASAAPVARVDNRSPLDRFLDGSASIDRAAVSARTLDQVLGRVATKGGAVADAIKEAARASDQAAAQATRAAQAIEQGQAVAIQKAAQAQEELASGVQRLRAQFDPTIAIQQRFNTQMDLLDMAFKQGVIGGREYAAMQGGLRAELQQSWAAMHRQEQGLVGVTRTSNATRFGMQNLGYQLQDVAVQFAGGQRAGMIFAQQAPQIVMAVQMMSGGTSKFATFMGGPWGAALGVGAAALGLLVTKLFDSKDAADKAKAAHIDLSSALDRQKASHDELAKAIDDYNQQQAKSTENTRLYVQQARNAAEADLKRALAKRALLKADLEEQMAAMKPGNAPALGNVDATAAYQQGMASEALRISDLIKSNAADITQIQTEINNRALQLGEFSAKALDPLEAIRQKYDDIRKVIRDTSAAGIFHGKPVEVVLRQVSIEQRAEEKSARDAAKTSTGNSNQQFGREIDMAQAMAIAKAAGFQVNSGTRSFSDQSRLYNQWVAAGKPSDNPVALPGSSAHETGHALDIQFGTGVSPATVRKAFADEGVRLTKLLTERGHYHVEFSTTGADKSNRDAETAARKAQAQADRQIRQQKEYADLSAGLDSDLLSAKRANVTDAGQIAQLARDQVAVERDKLVADIETKAALNPSVKAHKDELEEKAKQVAAQKLITIDTQEMQRKANEELSIFLAANDNQKEMLSLQESMAVTQEERRKLQLELLAKDKEEVRRRAQAVLDNPNAPRDAKVNAQGTLDTLDPSYNLRAEGIRQNTRSPLDRYIAENDPKLIGEKVESLMVDELESVRNGINDAISNALGVHDPLLKGLIDMFIEQVLIQPIAKALQSHMGGGGGGFLGSILSFAASAAGGMIGGSPAGIPAGVLSSGATSLVPAGGFDFGSLGTNIAGFAGGGDPPVGRISLVGEGGPELFMPKGPGTILPADLSARIMGVAANNNAPPVHIGQMIFPNVSNAREARETGRQAAASFQSKVAAAKRRGY